MKSQNDALLEYLKRGNPITSRDAYIELGITQLGRCLDDLEKRGYRFDRSRWIDVPTRHGEGTTQVKQYRLLDEDGKPVEPETGEQLELLEPEHQDAIGL